MAKSTVRDLSEQNSLVQEYVSELRAIGVQQDRLRFRANLARLGEIFAYEISRELPWKTTQVETPLGIAPSHSLAEQPILATILRAGLALHEGLLRYFDKADCAFISAYRRYDQDGNFDIHLQYRSAPSIAGRILIMSDPMLATASSMCLTLEELFKQGEPSHTHVVCAVASQEGIQRLTDKLPNLTVWVAAVDPELDDHGYIVPGLGDAGDLAYGVKE